MRIRRVHLVLPARMKAAAGPEARRIAETVALELWGHGPAAPSRLTLQVDGRGRSSRHLRHDLAAEAGRAVASRRRGD
jgi:hypothetical protein